MPVATIADRGGLHDDVHEVGRVEEARGEDERRPPPTRTSMRSARVAPERRGSRPASAGCRPEPSAARRSASRSKPAVSPSRRGKARPREAGHDLPAAHDQDAVAEAHQLLDLGGGDEHARRPRRRGRRSGGRPAASPRRRSRGWARRGGRRRASPSATCRAPPSAGCRRRGSGPAPRGRSRTPAARPAACAAAAAATRAGGRRPAEAQGREGHEGEVVGDGASSTRPSCRRSSVTKATPRAIAARGDGRRAGPPPGTSPARHAGRGRRGPAGSRSARRPSGRRGPRTSPRCSATSDPADAAARRGRHGPRGPPRRWATPAGREDGLDLPAHHQRDEARLVELGPRPAAHDGPVAQDERSRRRDAARRRGRATRRRRRGPAPAAGPRSRRGAPPRERLSEVVGSSRITTRASTASALTISTSCRSPGARSSTGVAGGTSRPTSSSRARACAPPAGRGPRAGRAGAGRARKTFSATLRFGKRFSSWCTKATPRAVASDGEAGA